MSRIQRTGSDCSVGALQNALRVHGRRIGYGKLARLLGGEVGEGDAGADEHDLLVTIGMLDHAWEELSTSRKRDAETWLRRFASLAPVLLCVDDWGHWVVVAGECGRRLCLHDSLRDPYNAAEGGTHWLRVGTLMRRWRAARRRLREEGGCLYYGIVVLPQRLTA